ncbi:MAG: M28 family peptidase [Bacteroidales bacterium]|nr:M28 family peptidase [Bacteroidales bacterium]
MRIFLYTAVLGALLSCSNANKTQSAKEPADVKATVEVPDFNTDSAYYYVKQQVEFGERVPNTKAHDDAALWLASELKRHNAEVTVQNAPLKAFDGTILNSSNIIGSFNPEKKDRILLFAHWDSRPFADHDNDKNNWKKPISGANDGASGVGVLLEIARQVGMKSPDKGIDILFVDSEDYGTPEFYTGEYQADSWALGAQYWAKRPHKPGYRARYGILLDMVGAKDAVFFRESYSKDYAPSIQDKIWKKAKELGHGDYFIDDIGGYITDDHVYINQIAKIPSVDIIHLDKSTKTGFFKHWHTVHDTVEKIDPQTLFVVGETLMHVIYNE